MPGILIFGAGNIGRAFIGQVFSTGGYDVVFADIQQDIIDALNERRSYSIVTRRQDRDDESVLITPVSAISVLDTDRVIREILEADILASSVGMNAISHIAPLIAAGIEGRFNRSAGPIDLILAENIHDGRSLLQSELVKHLPPDFELQLSLGIVQTSIGKMVPIVTAEDRRSDPLAVASEEYNELIVDSRGFLNPVPECRDILAVHPIEAYVDRKLFIHNLGHAVSAYLGFKICPNEKLIAGVLENTEVFSSVRSAMNQSAVALVEMYPETLNQKDLDDHIEDLLQRFRNRSLGDTVYRVGRDLARKLNRDDRILGAIRNCESRNLPWDNIGRAFFAAFDFKATDEEGNPDGPDSGFLRALNIGRSDFIQLCGLQNSDPVDSRIIEKLLKEHPGNEK